MRGRRHEGGGEEGIEKKALPLVKIKIKTGGGADDGGKRGKSLNW